MGTPQIILIVWFAMAFGISLCQHGKPKGGKNNCVYALITLVIETGLLVWGGFFS